MSKKSVSALLLALLAILASGALISTTMQMSAAFDRYRDSLETRRFAAADKTIFEGVLALRNSRGEAQSALLSEDDPRARLADIEKAELAGYDSITGALLTIDFAGRDEFVRTLQQQWGEAVPQFRLFFEEAGHARLDRKIERTNTWYEAVRRTIDTANLASIAVSNRAWMNDPFIARMVQVRRLAWQVRDRYGIQCSALRPNVNTSTPLDEDLRRTLAQWNGIAAAGWTGLDELLSAPGTSTDLTSLIKDARARTDTTSDQIANLIKGFDGSGRPAIPAQEWNVLCQSPFAAIVAIATKALDMSIVHADTIRLEALKSLIAQLLGFLIILATTITCAFVVRDRLIRPVRSLMQSIARIGAQDLATPVPSSGYADEFGTMAVALESLRESAAIAARLAREREIQQSAQIARSANVDTACRSFDDTVEEVIQSVSRSARKLDTTATEVHSLVSSASDQTAAVASAAEQTTHNLETIAAATEQLSASVGEISSQVQSSAREAREAVTQAERTNGTVEALDDAARRIGDVVKIINAIAGQTNLLALNATIEAARAGEAGRGFAIVAGEVKSLAGQTATATEDIAGLVTEIQGATGQTVEAIRLIGRAIGGVNEKMTAIAAAVDEQRAATTEISRNFQQAAQGTRDVTETIGNIAALTRDTGNAGTILFEAVRGMSADADRLRVAVEGFLVTVRAA